MKPVFSSKWYPEMNPLLSLLRAVLKDEWFVLGIYDEITGGLVAEPFGEVPPKSNNSAVTMAVLGNKVPKNGIQEPSVVVFNGMKVAIVGLQEKNTNEAVACAFLATEYHFKNAKCIDPMEDQSFWLNVYQTTSLLQAQIAPDQKHIRNMCEFILEEFRKKTMSHKSA